MWSRYLSNNFCNFNEFDAKKKITKPLLNVTQYIDGILLPVQQKFKNRRLSVICVGRNA